MLFISPKCWIFSLHLLSGSSSLHLSIYLWAKYSPNIMPTHTRLGALFLSCENYLLTHYQHDVPTEIYFSIILVDCTCKLQNFLTESFCDQKVIKRFYWCHLDSDQKQANCLPGCKNSGVASLMSYSNWHSQNDFPWDGFLVSVVEDMFTQSPEKYVFMN